MLEIQRITLTKAMKLLNSIGAEYAIIVDEEKHGTLEVVTNKQQPKKKSKAFASKYGRNFLRNYVRPYVDRLNVGDVSYIPAGLYELEAVAATAASYAHEIFGKGGHTGRKDKENNIFEIMRLEV